MAMSYLPSAILVTHAFFSRPNK